MGEFSWIKFFILFVPLTIMVFWMAPGIKWKLLLSIASAGGILLALNGKTIGRNH